MQPKILLIIDDSATSRLLFRMNLPGDFPYVIHEADSLDAAKKILAAIHPEIIVVDYNMPGLSGVEIARTLQRAGVNARFVLFTANTQKYILDEAAAAGFAAIIEKPVNQEKISNMLNKVGACN